MYKKENLADNNQFKDIQEVDFMNGKLANLLYAYQLYVEKYKLGKSFYKLKMLEVDEERVRIINVAELFVSNMFGGEPSLVIFVENEATVSLVICYNDNEGKVIPMVHSRKTIMDTLKKYKIDKNNIGFLFKPIEGSYDFVY